MHHPIFCEEIYETRPMLYMYAPRHTPCRPLPAPPPSPNSTSPRRRLSRSTEARVAHEEGGGGASSSPSSSLGGRGRHGCWSKPQGGGARRGRIWCPRRRIHCLLRRRWPLPHEIRRPSDLKPYSTTRQNGGGSTSSRVAGGGPAAAAARPGCGCGQPAAGAALARLKSL